MSTTQHSGAFLENTRALNGTGSSVWHKSAPTSLRKAFDAGVAEGWAAWRKRLASRKEPKRIASLRSKSLRWAIGDLPDEPSAPDWLEPVLAGKVDLAVEKELLGWIADSAGRTLTADESTAYAFDAITCCHLLPEMAKVLSAEVWWALLDHLAADAVDAGNVDELLAEDPLAHQILAGELALTLAYLFPEIAACRKLKTAGRQALSKGIVDVLDGEGLPHAANYPLFRPLLACWTRSVAVGRELDGAALNKAAAEQYSWMVRQALRFMRRDGSPVLSNGSLGPYEPALIRTALQLDADSEDAQIAAVVLPDAKKADAKKVDEWDLPWASFNSEWAGAAVLRPIWSRKSERLTVFYNDAATQIELACGKDLLFSGEWQLDIRADGKRLEPKASWDELCWIADEDVDYLELELQFGDVRVQRQLLMAREDGFLLLADAVLGKPSANIEYRSCLPLCGEMEFAEESHEGFLSGNKLRATVMPLAFPEWRAEESVGTFEQTSDGLELRQTGQGCLYAPLFFDLKHRLAAGASDHNGYVVTFCDAVFLTTPVVDETLATIAESDADVVLHYVERGTFEAADLPTQRTWLPVAGVELTGGAIYYVRRFSKVFTLLPRLLQLRQHRKDPVKFLELLGCRPEMDLPAIERTLCEQLGLQIQIAVSPHAELGLDVDKPADLELARRLLRPRQSEAA
jgi:hypothetical protein